MTKIEAVLWDMDNLNWNAVASPETKKPVLSDAARKSLYAAVFALGLLDPRRFGVAIVETRVVMQSFGCLDASL